MGEVVRLNANPGDEDSWWIAGGGTQEEAERASNPEAASILIPWERRATDAHNQAGLADLSDALWSISQATGAADTAVSQATDALLEGLDFTDAAATIALIQDIRRRLQVVEQYMTKRLGEAATEVSTKGGALPDGRLWEVRRGKVRKAWDHDSWKHDARAKIANEVIDSVDGEGQELVAYVVHEETGQVEDLNVAALLIAAMATAQEVHGSTAPRVTALKSLGMDPDEYAETAPGLWSLAVASPDPTTTTEEN